MPSQFSEKQTSHRDNTETRSLAANRDRVSVELSVVFEQAIFATIAYYDYFNYPLTTVEVYQYFIKLNSKTSDVLWTSDVQALNKPEFFEILKTLDENESLEKLINQKNGFYFLKGREELIEERVQKKKLTDEKFRKSRWILKFISCLPFTRLIMASGTMALGNPYNDSDIDLLVVAKSGRIWTARAIITFFAIIFGKYRHSGKTQNRLCLNHYITEKSLAIDFGNLYKAQEYLNLIPISGNLKIYNDFLAANRDWMENYVYLNKLANAQNLRFISQSKISLKIKYFFERLLAGKFGDWLEKYFKKVQTFFIQKNPLSSQAKGRLRYTDDNLVFHPVLIEPEVTERFNKKTKEFLNLKL